MTVPHLFPPTDLPTRTSPVPHTSEGARAGASALAAAVRARLRPVCLGWPPEQFAALITDVVRFHERWDASEPYAAPAHRP